MRAPIASCRKIGYNGRNGSPHFYCATGDSYSVGFTDSISLPEPGFPSPVLQMEIEFHHVPWLLEHENTY